MLTFEPKSLNNLMKELVNEFPLPMDLALKDDSEAQIILDNIRKNKNSLTKLTVNEFNLVYQIATLCTQDEFIILKNNFANRMTSLLFYIGWPYCQINANDKRAISLFSIACTWMKEIKPYEYNKTLIGKTGIPWDEIYQKAIKMMHAENLTIDEFCKNYNILNNSLFYGHLKLIYFATCGKDELRQNEAQLAHLITTASSEFLRPALINYSSKINYDEMSLLFKEAIIKRLSTEKSDNFIGLSPTLIAQIRQQRYGVMLGQCTNNNATKLNVYKSISSKINNIEFFPNGFFSLDFGSYVVVDNSEWQTSAYAYLPKIYTKMLEDWVSKQYADNFWPAMREPDLITARDLILGLNKGGVIKIEFNDFDILYTKDLLTNARYTNN